MDALFYHPLKNSYIFFKAIWLSVCTISVENAYLMIQMIFLHDHCLNALTKDRSTTFVHMISFDVACMGMVPNMEKGGSFLRHYDIAAPFPNFYTLM